MLKDRCSECNYFYCGECWDEYLKKCLDCSKEEKGEFSWWWSYQNKQETGEDGGIYEVDIERQSLMKEKIYFIRKNMQEFIEINWDKKDHSRNLWELIKRKCLLGQLNK